MGALILIGIIGFIFSCMLDVASLYFAIKHKESNNIKLSKLFYFLMIIGEKLATVFAYLTISLFLILIASRL